MGKDIIINKDVSVMPKVGDILVSIWGYSMVLVQYARVVKVSPKSIVVEYLKNEAVDHKDESFGCPYVIPSDQVEKEVDYDTDNRDIVVKERRLYRTKRGEWKSGKETKVFSLWDGLPKQEDHND